MDLREAIRKRRSIRSFRDETIAAPAIRAMKEALLWAPSAGDLQSRRFWFVTNPDLRAALAACSYQPDIIDEAALVVVGCADVQRIEDEYGRRGRSLYVIQDVAAAVQNLLLTVHALGLGAVWMGAFRPRRVARVLDMDTRYVPQVLVPIGVPAERPRPSARMSARRAFVDRT